MKMKEVDEIPSKIGVNEICLYRKGSDIDLEAIFGGRISSKKANGIKTNPVFKDGQGLKKGNNSSNGSDMGGIEIQVYNNIPKSSLEISKENDDLEMKKLLTEENSRTERDKVTVTNGEVCVGDIIIENGYRNPTFAPDTESLNSENDESDVLEHTVKYTGEGDTGGNMSGSEWPDIDDIALPEVPQDQSGIDNTTKCDSDNAYEMIDYNRNNTKVNKEIDPVDVQVDINQKMDSMKKDTVSELQSALALLNYSTSSEISENDPVENEIEKIEKNKSDNVHDIDNEKANDLSNNETNEENVEHSCSEISKEDNDQKEKQNGTNHQSYNGSVPNEEHKLNGSVNSNFSVNDLIHDEDNENEKGKSKKKNKKIKQRKNSLPDHILNSLNKKPSKPILVPVVDNSAKSVGRSRSNDFVNEQKTVKFSDDTVFNDNKPNKYKPEKVNLKDIYKGKISSKEAVAKMNPVFVDEDNHGLVDDEKNGLNTPAYMKDYIMSHDGDESTSVRRAGLEVDNDIESIGSDGTINYDRLIKKTVAKKRRSRILRFTCAIFTFCVVVGIVVLLVIFVGQKQS